MTVQIKELYWIAGFLEGEGSFCAVKRRLSSSNFDIRMSAGQVQREPLLRLQDYVGGIIYDRSTSEARKNAISYWNLNGKNAAALMMTLLPLMSPRRQEQIKLALSKWKANTPRNYRGIANPCAKLTEDQVIEIRKSSLSHQGMATKFGVSKTLISRIRLNKNWKHLPLVTGY